MWGYCGDGFLDELIIFAIEFFNTSQWQLSIIL